MFRFKIVQWDQVELHVDIQVTNTWMLLTKAKSHLYREMKSVVQFFCRAIGPQ